MELGGLSEQPEIAAVSDEELRPVAPGYKNVIRARMLITWLVLWGLAAIPDQTLLEGTRVDGLLVFGVPFLGIATLAAAPDRIYRRLRYRLTDRLLQVMRGWMFHTDTVVPLIRVQHLDVVRGPLDKMFGTATLVVHTAGTHNSIVTLPGLPPERAAEMRDAIREKVRTDFE